MSSLTKPYDNERFKHYRNIAVDLVTDTDVDLGTIQDDDTKVFLLGQPILFNEFVAGTTTTAAAVIIDNGTTGQNVTTSMTLTAPAKNRYFQLTVGTQPYAVTGTGKLRLHITANFVGNATTLRERTDDVALVTTAGFHGLVPGDSVHVLSMTDTTFNGRVTVLTVPTTKTFTYTNVGVDVVSGADTGGRVSAYDARVHVPVVYF